MDQLKTFNLDIPVATVGGLVPILFKMLEKFESLCLVPNMQKMAKAVDQQDWHAIMSSAHRLKGATHYIGAERLHKMSSLLREDCSVTQEHKTHIRYQSHVEESIACLREIRKVVSENQGTPEVITEDGKFLELA